MGKSLKQRKKLDLWSMMTLFIILLFIVFFVYPIIRVFMQSVYDFETKSFDLGAFKEFFSKPYYTDTIWNSLKVSFVSTLFATIIGLSLAYLFRKVKIKGKLLLEILIISSVISPPFIGAYAWIILLGRSGVITEFINQIFKVQFTGIYGFWGIVMVMALKMFPMVFLYVSGALKSIDNSLNEAGASLGSKASKTFFTVTVPLIMPTLLSSALLVFMRSLADFGTPMLIGEGYRTLPVLIYTAFVGEMGSNEAFGSAVAVIIMGATLLIYILQDWIANRKNVEMTALRPMQAKKAKGMKNVLAHAFAYSLVLTTVIPLVVVVFTSFLEVKGSLFVRNFSLMNYEIAFSKLGSAIRNTFLYSMISIVMIVILGVLIAYMSVRKRNRLSSLLDNLIMMPYVVPGSVIGIGLLGAFSKKPLLLMGTPLILIVSFVIRRLPYTVRSSHTILKQINPSIEEASRSLGDNSWETFKKISVPTMAPGILSGALMSWMTVVSELSASVILYVGSTRTLSIAIYIEVIRGNYGTASALSTILLFSTSLALFLFFKLTDNQELSI